MSLLDYSKRRLRAFLDEIQILEGLEFPYGDSRQALRQIGDTVAIHLDALERLDSGSDPATVRAACKSALTGLVLYLPLLGFIVRSTEVRNAFEVHGPFLSLSQSVLGSSTKLVLSSEWDYSPFTYLGVPVLREFVLIGLPATESSNPLLFPLAGHELGHSVWRHRGVAAVVSREIKEKIVSEIWNNRWDEYQKFFPEITRKEELDNDLAAQRTWVQASDWALRQSEETFCDLFGLRLFGKSYLHAFAYLLAPNIGGSRSYIYPNTRDRITNLIAAASSFGITVPSGYLDLFEDLPSDASPLSAFYLGLADLACSSVVQKLMNEVSSIITAASISPGTEAEVNFIYNTFKNHVVPAKSPVALSDILNAGWNAFLDPALWDQRPDIPSKERTLKELVLKSIEVLEFRQIMDQR